MTQIVKPPPVILISHRSWCKSWLFHFQSSSMPMHLGKQWKMTQVLDCYHPCGTSGWNSWLMASVWPNPSIAITWWVNQSMEDESLCLFSLCNFDFQRDAETPTRRRKNTRLELEKCDFYNPCINFLGKNTWGSWDTKDATVDVFSQALNLTLPSKASFSMKLFLILSLPSTLTLPLFCCPRDLFSLFAILDDRKCDVSEIRNCV